MIIAYLVFGMVFGAGLSALTLLNGGGVLLALVAYSAGGTLAIMVPFLIHGIVDAYRESQDWKQDNAVSA